VSSPRRIGLPQTMRMRHDTHFVDQLARPSGDAVGRLIAIEDIEPNPRQPRQSLGDLSELVASVREKGILEPILVRKLGARYEIIAGERRYQAAREAGLEELPCVVRDASDAEVMELALIENLQRKDLTPFEEADGLSSLAESHGYTHEMMAERLSRSRTSITETLALAAMPEGVRDLCRRADIQSKSLLIQIVRQDDPSKMAAFIERLEKEGKTRAHARKLVRREKQPRGRPRNFVFQYRSPGKTFALSLQFKRPDVPREEVIRTLESIVDELRGTSS
jgi:ParB family chromosome partitioning protein